MRKIISALVLCLTSNSVFAQDDTTTKNYTVHFQHTLIEQMHPSFSELSGVNTTNSSKSMMAAQESRLSSTTTLYIGTRVRKYGEFYINPEVAGGEGLSGATGMAGFPNGETFRVGSPKPQFYIARCFYRFMIPLSSDHAFRAEDQNILPRMVPTERLIITVGKFSLSDIFDQNFTSHDPKTSFLNWSLMDAGAWDYPSNTRGYTYAASFKLVKKKYILRFCTAVSSLWSNGPVVKDNEIIPSPQEYADSHGENLELIIPVKKDFSHFFKVMIFANHGPMALYSAATQNLKLHPNLDSVISNDANGNPLDLYDPRSSHLVSVALDSMRGKDHVYYGKYGFVLSMEKTWEKHTFFVRASWNDGQHETWMYTEIDRSLSFGTFLSGTHWKRPLDKCRIGFSINDISQPHKDYLLAGGYGFIIGDGFGNGTPYNNPNYPKGLKPEMVFEIQYSYNLTKQLVFSPDYQFCINPAYNPSRGPVHIFGLRAHFEI